MDAKTQVILAEVVEALDNIYRAIDHIDSQLLIDSKDYSYRLGIKRSLSDMSTNLKVINALIQS
jgi:hypothetical protein